MQGKEMSDFETLSRPCRRRALRYPRSAGPAVSCLGELNASLGIRLRELRVERGVSRTAIARAVGLTPRHVQEHECGVRRIASDKLISYAACLGVGAISLFARPAGERFSS